MDVDARVRRELDRVASRGRAGQILWRMRSDDAALDVTYGDPDQQFFIASATKLYVTAILAQLHAEGRLAWHAPIFTYLPDLDLSGLTQQAGCDAASTMTVQQVMAHTAGLPDYFEGKRAGGSTFTRALASDFSWDLDDVLRWSRELGPGTPGKGLYSDTGFQLLGAVIERLDGSTFAQSVQSRICRPLNLTRTYVFSSDDLDRFDTIATLRVGEGTARIPSVMASVQADGGIVSTLADGLCFMDAFFGGSLFPRTTLEWIESDWHRIFFPLEYGNGIMRFQMPAAMTGFRKVPAFFGHSGASGTVMFRSKELALTVTGTVNQVSHRSMPFRLLIRTALTARRR